MSRLNISCSVCKKKVENADTMCSTHCGHVFHYNCLQDCLRRKISCPLCQAFNPTSHKIYLDFESDVEYENIVADLNEKIKSYKDENGKIKKENEKQENKIDDVKRLYSISEQMRAELQDKIQILTNDSQIQTEKLTQEMATKSKEIQSLQIHIETLENEKGVESLYEKINEFSIGNSKLEKSLKASEHEKVILNQKIETLEQRLEYVSSELKKQYADSLGQGIKTDSVTSQKPQRHHNGENKMKSNNREGRRFKDSSNLSSEAGAAARVVVNEMQPRETKMFIMKYPNDPRIIITNFPRNYLVFPLNDTIILLANKMSIALSTLEISKVNLINSKNASSLNDKVVLSVEFKNIDKKIEFLTHRNRLKFSTTTHSIQIKEYIDESIYKLFIYANRNLRCNGYEFIASKDDKVIAKKKINEPYEIVIRDQAHVDLLLRQQFLEGRLKTLSFSLNSSRSSIFSHPFF